MCLCSAFDWIIGVFSCQVFESIRQELGSSVHVSEDYVEVCRVACSIARNCDPEVDTWCHSAWSHATSLSFWLLQVLDSFSSGEIYATSTSEERKKQGLEALAVWISDHFEYALALIETEINLTRDESATCDMIRRIIKLCPSVAIAVNAVRSCIGDFFQIISPKLKDPVASCVPFPLCSYFAHALVFLIFPNPLEVVNAPFSVTQFLAAANAPAVRSVFGVSSSTFNAIFVRQVALASAKSPTIESIKNLIAMVPESSSSKPTDAVQPDWETQFQITSRESTALILLDLLKNYRNTIVLPGQAAEKSLDLVEEVHPAMTLVSFGFLSFFIFVWLSGLIPVSGCTRVMCLESCRAG